VIASFFPSFFCWIPDVTNNKMRLSDRELRQNATVVCILGNVQRWLNSGKSTTTPPWPKLKMPSLSLLLLEMYGGLGRSAKNGY